MRKNQTSTEKRKRGRPPKRDNIADNADHNADDNTSTAAKTVSRLSLSVRKKNAAAKRSLNTNSNTNDDIIDISSDESNNS